MRKEAAEHAALEGDDQQGLKSELAELEARRLLEERREEVTDYIAARRETAALRTAREKVEASRRRVSNKITQLSSELVGDELRAALRRQLDALRFGCDLEVELRSKTAAGVPKYRLRLKSVEGVPLTTVLSQGEQRRLALAIFLAEMEVMKDRSPIVLDDPTSSIDQEGRRHIARCLARLARDRQVIVFTHEILLIRDLDDAARPEVDVCTQQVRRAQRTTGYVEADLPWDGLEPGKRAAKLQEDLARLRRLHQSADEEAYRKAAVGFMAELRATFERVVEDEVLGRVVTRMDDSVRTGNLKRVVLTDEICQLVKKGVDETSPWVHDQAPADGGDVPDPAELRDGLEVLERLRAAVKAERRRTQKRRERSEGALGATSSDAAPRLVGSKNAAD